MTIDPTIVYLIVWLAGSQPMYVARYRTSICHEVGKSWVEQAKVADQSISVVKAGYACLPVSGS